MGFGFIWNGKRAGCRQHGVLFRPDFPHETYEAARARMRRRVSLVVSPGVRLSPRDRPARSAVEPVGPDSR